MGEILLKFYKFVADEQGLAGKMKLAQMTKVPSSRAAMEADTTEIIDSFKVAVKEITGKDAPSF